MAAPAGAPPAVPPPAGAPPVAASPNVLSHQFITAPDGTQIVSDLTQNADGTYTVAGGAYAGLKLGSDRTPDPQSFAQVQAAQKAQAQPGGLTQQGFTYFTNPDGTLTITGRTDGKQLPGLDTPGGMNGAILSPNGMFVKPDGTPVMMGGQPEWSARTPSGAPATDNPNFNGDNVLYNSNGTGLIQTVPGVKEAAGAVNTVENKLSTVADNLKAGMDAAGAPIDTSGADAETQRANDLADALGSQAGQAGHNVADDRAGGGQTRDEQAQAIGQLQDAANGTVPSAAELQLKQQSDIDASRQYGLAAALQGNNPGAALRQASMGSAQIAGTTDQNAAVLRATEQANARNALANSLTSARAGDLSQQQTDTTQQSNLTQGQLTSQGQGVTSTGQKLTAAQAAAAAKAQLTGSILGGAATVGAAIASDKRLKKDVVKADLADALAKGVHGVTFAYSKDSGEDNETPHFGLLADELERTIPGVVKRSPIGVKIVDTGHLTTANTSIIAELARRLTELEKGRGVRR